MTLPQPLSEIAVGSSEHTWAFDASSNTLYQRNAVTKNFDAVSSNIQIAQIAVSYDGHLIALNQTGGLFVWDPSLQEFTAHQGVEQTFDEIHFGDDAIWALKGSTAYYWDVLQGGFVEVFTDAVALTVAKEDDTAYLLDGSGNLLRYDYGNDDWDLVTSDPGVASLSQLVAINEADLWGLSADGKIYQWNLVDYADADAPDATFIEKSDELGLASATVSQFALDDKGILYATIGTGVEVLDTEEVRIQNVLAEQTYDVALTTDSRGVVHYAYSTDGGIFHSLYVNGEWVRAQAIPGSSQGGNIAIETDGDDTVYISWVQGVGNAAEAYVAKGVRNVGYSGYTFGKAVAVTDDNVEDRSLDLAVTEDGQVLLTAAKVDATNPHDDLDIYHYGLDGDSARFALKERPVTLDQSGKVLEYGPTEHFLASAAGLEGNQVLLKWTGIGFSHGVQFNLGSYIAFRLLGALAVDHNFVNGTAVPNFSGELKLGADIKQFLKAYGVNVSGLGELKLSAVGQASAKGLEQLDISAGIVFNIAFDALGPAASVATGGFSDFLKTFGTEVEAGIFLETILLWRMLQVKGAGGPASDSVGATIPAPPITYIDSDTGLPITDNTPPQNISAEANLLDYALWYVNVFLLPFGVSIGAEELLAAAEGEAAATADEAPAPDVLAVLDAVETAAGTTSGPIGTPFYQLLIGLYAKAQTKIADQGFLKFAEASVKGRLGLQFNGGPSDGGAPYVGLDKIGARAIIEATALKYYFRLLDIYIGGKLGDPDSQLYAALPGSAEYITGGTTDVHGNGVLVFEGNEDGTQSDLLDAEELNFVLLADGSAHGVYVQEIIEQTQGSLSSVNTIDGRFDPETGLIHWDPSSIVELPGSRGLNFMPRIATRGDDTLVVVWSNTPADDPSVEALNATPPGKAYVLFGGPSTPGETLDLATLGNDPFLGNQGFYFGNDDNLNGLGAAASLLGDINPGGDPSAAVDDFAFSAPDADGESGKVYVVFGETYWQVTDIDDLGGTKGFTVEGALDSELGFALSSAGDFDGDGVPDIALSAPGASNHLGAVYVLSGGSDWTQNSGQFAVDDIGTVIGGYTIFGDEEGGRLGTALAGGYDVTGDGEDDLAIGSVTKGTVTLASLNAGNITLGLFPDANGQFDTNDSGFENLGASLAMLPDINEDGDPDLLIGSSNGTANVVFGGARFGTYAQSHVASFAPTEGYQVLLSFDGEDADRDGILSTTTDEITSWQMEVYQGDERVAVYSLSDQEAVAAFELNFEIGTNRVLANAGAGGTDLDGELYGLFVGLDRETSPTGGIWSLSSSASDENVALTFFADGSDNGEVDAATDALGNNLFTSVSTVGSLDLGRLDLLPGIGFPLFAPTALPLQVAAAGDVNGDGIGDLIVGYDQSMDEEGNDVSGRSYVLYGSSALTQQSQVLELDSIKADQGFAIDVAGGRVSAAGDVDGDQYDDLLVSAPHATDASGAQLAGNSFVVFGGAAGPSSKRYTLTDSNGHEVSGSALTSLGDLDRDGRSDFLIGAPQMIDIDNYYDAQLAAELVYSTRPVSGTSWSASATLNDGAKSEAPSATADTSLGTLTLWVDAIDAGDGSFTYALNGSFFDGSAWSANGNGSGPISAVVRTTEAPISEVAITEVPAAGEIRVVWIELNLEESQSTTVYQAAYDLFDETWSAAETVVPVPAEVPAHAPDNAAAILSDGGTKIMLEDVHASEDDGLATFTVTRQGDLSEASDSYRFRLFDYSAVHGADYRGDHEGTFAFAAGEDTLTIDVEILPDDLDEGGSERLRLEVWSENEAAYVEKAGLAVPGGERITATLFIEDSDSVLDLSSIDSGFQLEGRPDVSLGDTVATAGDVNGDGIRDFSIAAPTYGDGNEGRVYLLYGAEGIAIASQDLDLDTLDGSNGVVLKGTVEDGIAGTSVAANPIVNGASEESIVAIGAPGVADSQGRVYVIAPSVLTGQSQIDLDPSNVLELTLGPGDEDLQFGRSVYVDDLDGNGSADLVVASLNAIHVIYDIFATGNPVTGTRTVDDYPRTTTITNGEGTGFGGGLAILDFDGDNDLDLIVGSSAGNRLVDVYDTDKGAGGFVAVIRNENGFGTAVDVANLGDRGFRLLGQTELAPTDAEPTASPDDGEIEQALRSGMELVDGIGDAVAGVDLNGDGAPDLAIGAPLASLTDPDGLYTQDFANVGRVYVLFGGAQGSRATNWGTMTGDYALTDLYGDNASHPLRYTDGIVLEGTEVGGRAGAAVSDAGYFRGTTDQSAGVRDLAIGAPGVNAGAGQAFVVFGSKTNYNGLDKSQNIFQIDPTVDPALAGALPVFTFQGDAQTLSIENTSNQGALGSSVAGLGTITATGLNSINGGDLALGAPTTDVNGVGKTYVATGHPWIQPGQSLEVKDLRSDNGFITADSGRIVWTGDFDGDGFEDFITQNADSVILTLGASTFDIEASTNREITLDLLDGVSWQVTAGDYNGDGSLEIAAYLLDGEEAYIGLYASDALADPDATRLSPTRISGPQLLAFNDLPPEVEEEMRRYASEQGRLNTGDLNGDGRDDLLLSTTSFTSFFFYLASGSYYIFGTETFSEFTSPGPVSSDDPVERFEQALELVENTSQGHATAIVDFDNDGRDEVIVTGGNKNAGILEYDAATHALKYGSDFNWGGLPENGTPLTSPRMYAPTAAGDVNLDGYEDFLISFAGSRGGKVQSATMLVYGAASPSEFQGTLVYPATAIGSPSMDANIRALNKYATIAGDVNGDGYADILVSQANTDQDLYVVYGGDGLPDYVETPTTAEGAADFEYGFAIKGLTNRSQIYEVGKSGDVNGDGVSDFVISDTDLDLTYTIYGERRSQTASTKYIDGTPEDDYILQTRDGNRKVSIFAKEGDDFIQTLNGYEVLVYGGEGDDKIGLGQVDGSKIGRIDGGTGDDLLFFDPEQIGSANTLDLTAIPGRITDIEVIDLGSDNGLTFDIPTLRSLTGAANTLIVKGVDAFAKARISPDYNGWARVGVDAYDGDLYDIYRYTLSDGTKTNFYVWTERGGVTWQVLTTGTAGNDRLWVDDKDNEIDGQGGNDHIWGLCGDDILNGGDGDDWVLGGSGNDVMLGGAGKDFLIGGSGNDEIDGGEGNDILRGGFGNDDLDGGDGDDLLWGGPSDDAFVIAAGVGHDTIKDLRDGDVIRLEGFGLEGFSELQALFGVSREGNAVISFSDEQSVEIANLTPDELSESQFVLIG